MSDGQSIKARISDFKADLNKFNSVDIVRKHIIFGDCYLLVNDVYFQLKNEVATHFKIHPSEVVVVGSAKLGFTIKQGSQFRHFGDSSDIDVVLLCSDLFDKVWVEVFDYAFKRGYWPKAEEFKRYLFRGWIRPDKLPKSKGFSFSNEWFDFFRIMTNSGKYGEYKINAGLYKNWHFIEQYQSINVIGCQELKEVSP